MKVDISDRYGIAATNVMNAVKEYLIENGKKYLVEVYLRDAHSGDYMHLLSVSQKYMPGLEFVTEK